MMTDYIERKALREILDGWRDAHADVDDVHGCGLLEDVICEVDAQPAADVAEVVRCKNCKWFADNNGGEWYGCQMFQVVRITPEDAPKPDDFCSYGERKEESPCD